MVYGYCRISRRTQNIERQKRNILQQEPTAKIYEEAYTGTKITGREEWNKLYRQAIKDTECGIATKIIFDSVSRMSRNADDGIRLYFELYDRGIELEFLKEPYINTETYKENIADKIELTGTDEDEIFKGLNNYFRKLARRQIRIAFEQAQKEVDDLHQRTKEGIETARANGKQIGQKPGTKLNVKKETPAKEKIRKYNKDFGGQLNNQETWEIIGISKMTFYKYKKEILMDMQKDESL